MSLPGIEAWNMFEALLRSEWVHTIVQFFYGPPAHENVRAARWFDADAPDNLYDGLAAVNGNARIKIVLVELKCLMCCEACENRVRTALSDDSDFTSFVVDRETGRVAVGGEDLEAEEVLKIVTKASKKYTELLWPPRRAENHMWNVHRRF